MVSKSCGSSINDTIRDLHATRSVPRNHWGPGMFRWEIMTVWMLGKTTEICEVNSVETLRWMDIMGSIDLHTQKIWKGLCRSIFLVHPQYHESRKATGQLRDIPD